jgi:streptogramin lyase
MKIKFTILAASVACLSLFLSASALQAAPAGAFIEWALPVGAQTAAPSTVGSSEPLHVLPSFNDEGSLFFTQYQSGYIGRLNSRNEITEWSLGASFPHDLAFVGLSIILTEVATHQIGQFRPDKNSIKEWTVFDRPEHLDRVGPYIYFSESDGSKGGARVGRLDLVTNQITEWNTAQPFAVIGLDADGSHLWFLEAPTNFAAVLDTINNTITQYPLDPLDSTGRLFFPHLKICEGKAFLTDQRGVVEVDPATNTVFEWLVPTANAATDDLAVQRVKGGFLIEFSEFLGDKVASLNTALQAPNSSVVVTPIVVPRTPIVTTVVPATRLLTPVVTEVAPVITKVSGVVTGGFIEWAVPTPASGPGGVATLGPHILLFTERSGNKIAILLH